MDQQLPGFFSKRPLIISGPCSAETEEQVMETARQLIAGGKTDIFRAGTWKPRTRPGMFEGTGAQGLEWLVRVKKELGLPVITEVANTMHVQEALKRGFDLFWIGARTTVNPFSVQEIAEALRGNDVTVFIKNPVNPDIELWCGAVERMRAMGISKIGIIHRGFHSYGITEYRNAPMWNLPIEMKRRYPEMILICDPSHICGSPQRLQEVAQHSLDLDFDGLMIESHIDPPSAKSDAKQQITPREFQDLINSLVVRVKSAGNGPGELEIMREKIDHLDKELLSLLSMRMKIADGIGQYKKENNITILQSNRWRETLEKALTKGNSLQLSHEFLTKYFDAVHMESIMHQNSVMKAGDKK